jgi:hypothetical protein
VRWAVRSYCSVDTRAYPTSSSFINQRWGSPAMPVKLSLATARKWVR